MNSDKPSHHYRLVVADIDGTLLDSAATLRPAVRDAVVRARAAGIAFTIATGRRYVTARPVLEALGFVPSEADPCDGDPELAHFPVVLQTGAAIVSADGFDVLRLAPLPEDETRQALQVLIDHRLQPILYERRILEQRLLTGPAESDSIGGAQYLRGNPHLVIRSDLASLLTVKDPLQIAVIGDLEPLEAVVPYLQLANCRTIISYSPSLNSHFMEVFHRPCSKGSAVAWVAQRLGIPIEQVLCIGDNWNDVEMLALAGCGLAVANSEPGILPYARRLAPSNDQEAVAAILDQVLRGEEPGAANGAYRPDLALDGSLDRASDSR